MGMNETVDNQIEKADNPEFFYFEKYKLEKEATKTMVWLKRGVWAYFILLIFEGALRKWFLPMLATPLLIIRDPLALWLIFVSLRNNVYRWNTEAIWMVTIASIGLVAALIVGHKNLWVAIYGARIFWLHFPLIFVIGRIFNREDVLKVGNVVLWIGLPMTILIGLQFYSPQSSWVNRGVGGNVKGAGFGGALGYFRPPGTFSFTNGTTLFYGFLAAYLFYFWINTKNVNIILLAVNSACLLAAIPLSISRGLFFQVGVSILFATMAVIRKPKYVGKIVIVGVIAMISLVFLSKAEFFNTATLAFTERFTTANEAEGGLDGVLGDRYLGGMIGALKNSADEPFFGYGIGLGTNVGSMLTAGDTTFKIAEEEWARMIGELGPLLGLMAISIRVIVSVKISLASYKKLAKNDILPWMLLSFGLLTVPQAQWAQPTSLGFSILIGGLMVASLRNPPKETAVNNS